MHFYILKIAEKEGEIRPLRPEEVIPPSGVCRFFPSFLVKMHGKKAFFYGKSQKKREKPTSAKPTSPSPKIHNGSVGALELRAKL
jgi:hypothetical protein